MNIVFDKLLGVIRQKDVDTTPDGSSIKFLNEKGDFVQIPGLSDSSTLPQPGHHYITVSSADADNFIYLDQDYPPYSIKAPSGNLYTVAPGMATVNNGSIALDMSPYMAYQDAATFQGNWILYF